MTAKQQAEEIVTDFMGLVSVGESRQEWIGNAVKAAIYHVEKIIDVWENQQKRRMEEWLDVFNYWQEVLTELKKI